MYPDLQSLADCDANSQSWEAGMPVPGYSEVKGGRFARWLSGMLPDSRIVKFVLFATFGLSVVLPRDTMPCCRSHRSVAATDSKSLSNCCCSNGGHKQLPADSAPVSKNEPCAPGGLGCVSPCCSKVPAPTLIMPVLALERTDTLLVLAVADAPRDPTARGIFHPPR